MDAVTLNSHLTLMEAVVLECHGEGVIYIEMQFMADVQMVCESCGGKRFKQDILEVK